MFQVKSPVLKAGDFLLFSHSFPYGSSEGDHGGNDSGCGNPHDGVIIVTVNPMNGISPRFLPMGVLPPPLPHFIFWGFG